MMIIEHKLALIVTLCFTCISLVLSQMHVCQQVTECKCQFTDDGTIVDITSLGNKDGTPRFKDVPSADGYLYSYNPCGGFTEDVCANAAVCRRNRIGGASEMIGAAEMPQFTYDELTGDTVIGYTAGALGNIHTFVYLMCDPSKNPGPPQFFPNGTQSQNLYVLMLYSACACGDRCDDNGVKGSTSSSSYTIKTIISTCVFIVFIVYCITGVIVTKLGDRTQKGELFHNSKLWCGLGSLIEDGFRFSISKCKGRTYEPLR